MTRAVLCSLVLWPLYLLVFAVFGVVGWVVLLPLSLCHAWHYRPSKVNQFRCKDGADKLTAWWGGWLTWVWGNEEDGVIGPIWWRQRQGTDHHYTHAPRDLSTWLAIAWSTYRWSALRNPVNNLRFIPGLNPRIVPTKVGFRSLDIRGGAFTWQGPYAGLLKFFRIRGTLFRFWLGWKLKPGDTEGVDPGDMRATRCGFAIQFKRVG